MHKVLQRKFCFQVLIVNGGHGLVGQAVADHVEVECPAEAGLSPFSHTMGALVRASL